MLFGNSGLESSFICGVVRKIPLWIGGVIKGWWNDHRLSCDLFFGPEMSDVMTPVIIPSVIRKGSLVNQ